MTTLSPRLDPAGAAQTAPGPGTGSARTPPTTAAPTCPHMGLPLGKGFCEDGIFTRFPIATT